MSVYQQKHIELSFNVMFSDKQLDMRVKIWFVVFVAQQAPDWQELFRRPGETSDFQKFLERHEIPDITKVPSCTCSCGKPVTDDVYKVLKRCSACNRKVCAVRLTEKNFVWEDANKKRQKGKCYCCDAEIVSDNFSAAHVVAVRYGGRGVVSNLKPTCHSCNAAMMTTHLEVYKAELVTIGDWLRFDPTNRMPVMENWWQEIARAWSPTSGR